MRVGIVAEGVTEFQVFEALIRQVRADVEVERIWPDIAMGGRPYGWRGVRSWCREMTAVGLETVLRGVRGRELDALIVHVDCSMAHNVDARHTCPPARTTADELRGVVRDDWLDGRDDPWLLVVAPAQSTDAWFVAAVEPPWEHLDNVECEDAEIELVRRRLLRRRGGQVKKPAARVRPLVEGMIARWDRVVKACGEARRFEQELSTLLGF